MPFIIGSTTPSHRFAAIAPSTAVPPASSMLIAHMVLSGTDVAAITDGAWTGERPAKGKPVGRVPPQLLIHLSFTSFAGTQQYAVALV